MLGHNSDGVNMFEKIRFPLLKKLIGPFDRKKIDLLPQDIRTNLNGNRSIPGTCRDRLVICPTSARDYHKSDDDFLSAHASLSAKSHDDTFIGLRSHSREISSGCKDLNNFHIFDYDANWPDCGDGSNLVQIKKSYYNNINDVESIVIPTIQKNVNFITSKYPKTFVASNNDCFDNASGDASNPEYSTYIFTYGKNNQLSNAFSNENLNLSTALTENIHSSIDVPVIININICNVQCSDATVEKMLNNNESAIMHTVSKIERHSNFKKIKRKTVVETITPDVAKNITMKADANKLECSDFTSLETTFVSQIRCGSSTETASPLHSSRQEIANNETEDLENSPKSSDNESEELEEPEDPEKSVLAEGSEEHGESEYSIELSTEGFINGVDNVFTNSDDHIQASCCSMQSDSYGGDDSMSKDSEFKENSSIFKYYSQSSLQSESKMYGYSGEESIPHFGSTFFNQSYSADSSNSFMYETDDNSDDCNSMCMYHINTDSFKDCRHFHIEKHEFVGNELDKYELHLNEVLELLSAELENSHKPHSKMLNEELEKYQEFFEANHQRVFRKKMDKTRYRRFLLRNLEFEIMEILKN